MSEAWWLLCGYHVWGIGAGADAAAAHADQDELRPSASGSIGDTLHDAKETTVSGASVAVLILWTIAVTGWTGFQVCSQQHWVWHGVVSCVVCCMYLLVFRTVVRVAQSSSGSVAPCERQGQQP